MVMRDKINSALVIVFIVVFFGVPQVAAQYRSSNYKSEETYFGTGSQTESNSTNYKSMQSSGAIGVGDVSSNSYRAGTGFLTPHEPFVELTVSGSDVDLGILSTTSTSSAASQGGTCNCTFSVKTYLSGAYIVKTMSNPPTNENGHSLLGKPTQGAPSVGSEEFGINVVANTAPSLGANPVNIPDNTFADGEAGSGLSADYATANQFKYVVGDTIAHSAKTSGKQAIGQTDYTITYIANIGVLTHSGLYSMKHDLVVVAVY